MSITLELTPEQEEQLNRRAEQQGQAVSDYLLAIALRESFSQYPVQEQKALLQKEAQEHTQEVISQESQPDEWLTLLYSMGVETGVSLTDEQTRRESLYEDHL